MTKDNRWQKKRLRERTRNWCFFFTCDSIEKFQSLVIWHAHIVEGEQVPNVDYSSGDAWCSSFLSRCLGNTKKNQTNPKPTEIFRNENRTTKRKDKKKRYPNPSLETKYRCGKVVCVYLSRCERISFSSFSFEKRSLVIIVDRPSTFCYSF